jgi:hypothetical protein
MASDSSSSEISSSEQRVEGGMEAAGEIRPVTGLTLTPDEGVWKKYSRNYEFPLSMLASMGLHLLVLMIVLAYLSICIHFAGPKDQEFGTFVLEPNADNRGDNPRAGGGASGDQAAQEPSIRFELSEKMDRPLLEKQPEAAEKSRIPDGLRVDEERQRPGPVGQMGSRGTGGSGDGTGSGKGNQYESGVSRSGVMPDGPDRWRINLRYDEPRAFVEKLATLRVAVGARLLNGRYIFFDRLPERPPYAGAEMSEAEFLSAGRSLNRIWFASQERTTCENFAIGIDLADRITTLYIFLPRDLEAALRAAEQRHLGLSADEIKKRRVVVNFEVIPAAGGWDVRVVKTTVPGGPGKGQ